MDTYCVKLNMWRVFYGQKIEFKYIMLNKSTDKYQFVNFSTNCIEYGEYDTIEQAIEHLEYLLQKGIITQYQSI